MRQVQRPMHERGLFLENDMASKSSGKRKAAPVVGQRSISAFFKPSTGPLQVSEVAPVC